jgi:hypothetical protein
MFAGNGASARSFIRAAEIWRPSADGRELAFGGGVYGALTAFEAVSRDMRFGRGEGLPGQAWATRRPVVMKRFDEATFRRVEAAAEAGLTSGIALPVFARDDLKAVVVLFCGDDESHVGAIEAWRFDPDLDAQMGLHDGYYGGAELFEMTSRTVSFGKGFGLPGTVWETGMPVLMRDLYLSDRFLRREEALKVGITLGLGLPFEYDPGRFWVMAFLSALSTPLIRRFEVWTPDEGGSRLIYESGIYADRQDGEGSRRPAGIRSGEGPLGEAFASRVPTLVADCAADAPWLAGVGPPESRSLLALPVLDGSGQVKAVTAWNF